MNTRHFVIAAAYFLAVFLPTSVAFGQVLGTSRGGTGTGTTPATGQVLVGQANGTFAPQATSTLGFGPGTVTSVGLSIPTGFTVAGSPITGAGSFTLDYAPGYGPTLTASSTDWQSFFALPSSRITAGSNLSWSGDTLNATIASSTVRGMFSASSPLSYDAGSGAFSLSTGGDWTGTLDGQEGSYYLSRANHSGTQTASTISDFSGAARALLSSDAIGLTYNSSTGVFTLSSGYTVPQSDDVADWSTAYGWGDHGAANYFDRDTDDFSDISGTVAESQIDATIARDSELHDAVTVSGTPDYITLSDQEIIRSLIDLAADTTGVLAAENGGTGQSTYTTGDLLYASGADSLAKRSIGEVGDVLIVSGGLPTWTATSTLGITSGIGSVSWGDVLGTLADQTDLQATLDSKISVGTTSIGSITALPSLLITESQISDLAHYTDADTAAYLSASSTIWKNNTEASLEGFLADVSNVFTNNDTIDISDNTNLAVSATGLDLAGDTIDLAGGYAIPLAASTTDWEDFYDVPSNRINAGTGLSWSGDTLNAETAGGTVTSVAMSVPTGLTVTGSPITDSGTLAVALDTGYVIPLIASTTDWSTAYGWGDHSAAGYLTTVDISDHTNLVAGTNLTLTGDTLDVDDAFLLNSGDTASGNYTFDTDTFFIDATNNRVGVGTTSPSTPLAVQGTAQATLFNVPNITDANAQGYMANYVGQAPRWLATVDPANQYNLRYDSTGSGSWAQKLIINTSGGIYAGSGTAAIPAYGFISGTDNGMYLASTDTLGFSTNGAAKLTINSTGDIGIGDTNPTSKLMLADVSIPLSTANDGNIYVYTTDTAAIDKGASIALGGSWSGTTKWTFGAISGRKENSTGGDAAGYLAFSTYTNGAGVMGERMRISSAGNVGIGDTSPAAMLTVGSGDLFQVNSSGAIAAATGITSSGTVTFSGLTNGFLKTNGSGVVATSTVSVSDITPSSVVTEAEGISSNDNDTTVPTSAAVKDYVDDNAGGGTKLYLSSTEVTCTNGNCGSGAGTEHTAFSTTIPANTLGTNNGVHLTGFVSGCGVDAASNTLRVRVKYGGTTITTMTANATDNVVSGTKGTWDAYILADGATDAQKGYGDGMFAVGNSEVSGQGEVRISKIYIEGLGSAAVDSTSDQTLTVTVQMTNNSAEDCVFESLLVQKIQ